MATEPEEMLSWLDRRIASALTWLAEHGRGAKKPRPESEIESKEYDVARFEEIKAAYSGLVAQVVAGGSDSALLQRLD